MVICVRSTGGLGDKIICQLRGRQGNHRSHRIWNTFPFPSFTHKKTAQKAKWPISCPNSQSTIVHKTCTLFACALGTSAIPNFTSVFNILKQKLAKENQIFLTFLPAVPKGPVSY